jgi:hypothetical protein
MKLQILFLILIFSFSAPAQSRQQPEVLTNADVIGMTRAGVGKHVIQQKIEKSQTAFDASTKALIELKTAGVDDDVIALILEKAGAETQQKTAEKIEDKGWSENAPASETLQFGKRAQSPKEALLAAKTVALVKSSLNPSRQALEKALLKRADWRKYDLTIVRYKDQADIYIEIGRIPLSWLTHRYVFRVFDRRSGAIITAGETTSWGSLGENLAREITQKLASVN